MSRILVTLVGVIVVFHAKALTTPSATPQALTTPSPTPQSTPQSTGNHENKPKEEEKGREIKSRFIPKASALTASLAVNLCTDSFLSDLTRPGSLVQCTCGVDEVLENGVCAKYPQGTMINKQTNFIFWEKYPVANLTVKVQDVDCRDEDVYQSLTFGKDLFYLRNRGDVVLLEAEELSGIRVSEYCVDHYLDHDGSLNWKMKACIPHPIVPRCCPDGQILKNGTCTPDGSSLGHLSPPIRADPIGKIPSTWPIIRNQINNVRCSAGSLMTESLGIRKSYLTALPDGLAYRWYPSDPAKRPMYKHCPEFCIDGRQSANGSVEYFASFCLPGPDESPEDTCQEDTCIKKCCKEGEIMSRDHFRCIKHAGEPFEPPVPGSKKDYDVVIGKPECHAPNRLIHESTVVIDDKGNLRHDDTIVPTADYCVDVMAVKGDKNTGALICKKISFSTWFLVRPIVFVVCLAVSLIFLGITVAFYLLTTELLKLDGWHQLCYVLSLILAYTTGLSLNVHPKFGSGECIAIALLMQFGYLSTFSWLCVMCYDIESKIRFLRDFRTYNHFHPVVYAAFGFGVPLVISIVTIIMETAVSHGTPGVIKPSIGISRCWFYSDSEVLAYFYGPIAFLFVCNMTLIASTAWNYWKLDKGASGMVMKFQAGSLDTDTIPLDRDRVKQTKRSLAEFRQIFMLVSLMCFCWVTEILSWKIPPPELWAFTDVLNTLQGLFIFVIFLSNRRNRKILKKRHPWLISAFGPLKGLCRRLKGGSGDAESNHKEVSLSSESSDLDSKTQGPTER